MAIKSLGIMKNKIVKLSAAILFIAHITVSAASETDCEKVFIWAHKGWAQEKHSSGALHKGKRMVGVLENLDFIPAFNRSVISLKSEDISGLKAEMNTCWNQGRKLMQAASKKGDRETVKKYNEANNFMRIVFRIKASDRDPANFKNILIHQQTLFVKKEEAIAESKRMLALARSFKASKVNVQSINAMKQGPFLAYLGKAQKTQYLSQILAISDAMTQELAKQEIASFEQYEESLGGLEAFLQNRQFNVRNRVSDTLGLQQAVHVKLQRLSEAAITDAVAMLEAFKPTIASLRELIIFQQRVTIALRKAKSMGNHRFDKAYKAKLDELAEMSLPEFIEELTGYAVTDENLKRVNSAVQTLFSQQPLPNNIKQYRQAALKQAEVMQTQLTKVECYAGISESLIKKDQLDTGLLDGVGASTIGLFICQLAENHFQLLSYKGSGFLASTHVLKLKTPRGMTLTLNLEPLEVNKGEVLLVGKVAKDAGGELRFTLAQWQDYAQKMTH